MKKWLDNETSPQPLEVKKKSAETTNFGLYLEYEWKLTVEEYHQNYVRKLAETAQQAPKNIQFKGMIPISIQVDVSDNYNHQSVIKNATIVEIIK